MIARVSSSSSSQQSLQIKYHSHRISPTNSLTSHRKVPVPRDTSHNFPVMQGCSRCETNRVCPTGAVQGGPSLVLALLLQTLLPRALGGRAQAPLSRQGFSTSVLGRRSHLTASRLHPLAFCATPCKPRAVFIHQLWSPLQLERLSSTAMTPKQ